MILCVSFADLFGLFVCCLQYSMALWLYTVACAIARNNRFDELLDVVFRPLTLVYLIVTIGGVSAAHLVLCSQCCLGNPRDSLLLVLYGGTAGLNAGYTGLFVKMSFELTRSVNGEILDQSKMLAFVFMSAASLGLQVYMGVIILVSVLQPALLAPRLAVLGEPGPEAI